MNEQSGLSLNARRTRQRTSPITDRAGKRTWFNEACAFHSTLIFPLRTRYLCNCFFVFVLFLFCYLQLAIFTTRSSLNYIHTFIYILFFLTTLTTNDKNVLLFCPDAAAIFCAYRCFYSIYVNRHCCLCAPVGIYVCMALVARVVL